MTRTNNRALANTPNNFVSVLDYGAVGDGVTDDTDAIQAAVDSGQPVLFPKATYAINDTILLPSNTIIDLGGSTITSLTEFNNGFRFTGKSNTILRNGTFYRLGTAVVLNEGTEYITLENLTANQCNNGFQFNGTGLAVKNITTSNLVVRNAKNYAYYHYNTKFVTHNTIKTYNAVWGFNCVSLNDQLTINGAVFELGASGSSPGGDDDAWYSSQPEHGMYLQSSNNLVLNDIYSKGWNRQGGASGLKFRNGDNIRVHGGYIEDSTQVLGLFIQEGSTQDYLTNIEFNGVRFDNGTIFITDYDQTETCVMGISFVGCNFGRNSINHNIDSTPAVARDLSYIKFTGCVFNDKCTVNRMRNGTFDGCIFKYSFTSNLDLNQTRFTSIQNCVFLEWGFDPDPPGGNAGYVHNASIRASSSSVSDISINGCTWIQSGKRNIGVYGATAGVMKRILVFNCTNLDSVWSYQSGGDSESFIYNCSGELAVNTGSGIILRRRGANLRNGRYHVTLSTYADDTAADAAGLVAGDMYKNSAGDVKIKL